MKTRKKSMLFTASLILITALCFALSSCGLASDQIKVIFDSNGGSTVESVIISKDSTLNKPADPTMAGYTFAGWYLGEEEFSFDTMITEGITLTAKWTPDENTAYTVKHYQEKLDGTGYEEVEADEETLHGTTGEDTEANAKEYVGFTAQDVAQAKIAGDGTTVVEIRYDRNTMVVTWVVEGEPENVEYKYGAMPSHEDPEKDADNTYTYAFAGWGEELSEVTENKTYTAVFTPEYINYTVTFKDENGEVISSKADYHYGDAITAPAAPEKAADETYTYTFDGWNNAENVTGNVEYTASFTPEYINYTVTFKAINNDVISSKTDYHYGDDVTVPNHSESAAGYTYGWDAEVAATVTANVTYTETKTANTNTAYSVKVSAVQYEWRYDGGYYFLKTDSKTYVDKTSDYADILDLDGNGKLYGTTDTTADLTEKLAALVGCNVAADSVITGNIDGDGSLELTVKLDFDEDALGFGLGDIKLGQWSCDNLVFSLQYIDGVCGMAIDGTIGNGKEIILDVGTVDLTNYGMFTLNYYEKSANVNNTINILDGADTLSAEQSLGIVNNPAEYVKAPVNILTKFPAATAIKQIRVKLLGGGEKHVFIAGISKAEYKKETVTYSVENENLSSVVKALGQGTASEVNNHTFANTNENIDLNSKALLYKYTGDTVTGEHATGITIDLGAIKLSDYKTFKITFQTIVNNGGTVIYCNGVNMDTWYGGAHVVDLKALAENKGMTSVSSLELAISSWASVTSCEMYIASIELELAD